MSFRENLLRLRTEHNMTQEQLAALVGVSRQSVAKWEAERSYPEMDKLIKMTGIFGCTLDELVMGRADDGVPDGDPTCGPQVSASCEAEPLESATGPTTAPATGPAAGPAAGPATGPATAPSAAPATVPSAAPAAAPSAAPATDTYGYDAHMRRFATKMAWGVASIILGVAALILTKSLISLAAGSLAAGYEAESGLVLLPLFAGILIGLALIIPACLGHAAFMKKHPVIRDFYSFEQKRSASTQLAAGIVAGLASIFTGILLADYGYSAGASTALFLIGRGIEAPLAWLVADGLAATALMVLVAAGVWCFIWFGIRYSRVHVGEHNKESLDEIVESESVLSAESLLMSELSPEERRLLFASEDIDGTDSEQVRAYLTERKRKNKLVSGICSIVMILATIVGLCLLFGIPSYSPYFWMAWVVGGLCCAIATVAVKTFGK